MADLLHKIVDTYVTEVQSLSDGILVPPATEKEIGLAERDAIQHLGAPLDQEYLDLARLADGLGARGTNVYSVTPRKLVSARTGRTSSLDGLSKRTVRGEIPTHRSRPFKIG
jgi:hypothetical protein